MVIKFAHRLPENRAIGNNTRMYEREVLFFNEIATQLDTPKTHCYFAGFNADTGGNMVIMKTFMTTTWATKSPASRSTKPNSWSITSRHFTHDILMLGERTSATSTPSIAMTTSPPSSRFYG